ncbi:MAG: putative metal-binding motif-containing protein [Nannocystaceae bacterium]
MTRRRLPRLALAATLTAACSGTGPGESSESATSGESTTESTSAATTSTSGETMSATQATTTSGASDSATTTSTSTQGTDTEATGVSVSGTESSTEPTTDATDATTDPTDATSTTDTTDGTSDGTTTDTTDGTTTDTTDGTTTEDTTTGCVPAPEICNDIDDDCNGFIDDVDEAMDGICDCLNIVILGKKGYNPSSQFETWLEAQGTQVDRIHTTVNEVLDADTLAPYDIVILDWLQRNYNGTEAAALETWIAGGGGMMSMTGFINNQTNADVTNSLITSIGLTYNTSKGWFDGPVTMFANHPITMGLTSISYYGGLYVNLTNDGVGVNQTIMTMSQGPVGVVQERKAGRAFVFGDEWVEFDSEWQNIPQVKQFWVQTLKWVGPQNSCVLPQ